MQAHDKLNEDTSKEKIINLKKILNKFIDLILLSSFLTLAAI